MDGLRSRASRAALDDAGWTLVDGKRQKDGKVLQVEVSVVSGWSDWVRAAQVVSRSLQEVGVEASVLNQDFGSWFQRLQQGEFDVSLGGRKMDPIRLDFTKACSLQDRVQPVGTTASINWHRYADPMQTRLWMPLSKLQIPCVNDKLVKPYRNPLLKMFPLSLCSSTLLGESSTVRAFTGFPPRRIHMLDYPQIMCLKHCS